MFGDNEDDQELPEHSRVWDFAQVVMAGRRYRIEDIGFLSDGGALFAAFVAVAPGVG